MSSLPPLRRIQILALSVEATEALYPEIAKLRSNSSQDNLPEPEPILKHLSKLLESSEDRCIPVAQFQTFFVGSKVYAVVDMEAIGKGKILRGLLAYSTSIITQGLPLEPLATLHVCIVRPFSHRDPEDQSFSVEVPTKSSSKAVYFRRLFRQRSRQGTSEDLGADADSVIEVPVIIDLKAVLESYIKRYPCLVFSPGQQLQLPILPELENLKLLKEHPNSRKGLSFFVYSTSNSSPGVVIPGTTEITIELDPIGEFEKIDISPLVDTVPQSYEFDFFNEYIRPFVEANPFRLLCQGTLFSFHAVQFKVQYTTPCKKNEIGPPDGGEIFWKPFNGIFPASHTLSPILLPIEDATDDWKSEWKAEIERLLSRTIVRRGQVCRRIGRMTHVHRSDPIQPQLRDILPPNVMNDLLRLPTRLQSIAAIHAIADLAPQDLIRILGLAMPEQGEPSQQQMRERVGAKVLGEFATIYKKTSVPEDSVCVVCLSSVTHGDQVLELPCSHVFHLSCVEEWLKRSVVCPVCKRDLRDFLNETIT